MQLECSFINPEYMKITLVYEQKRIQSNKIYNLASFPLFV